MDNIPSYIKRKHGEEEITYLHPMLEPILKETYGIMIYQEQVMNIARALGGYTMGGADKLRKVMGKKMRDEIPKQRNMFMEGAVKNGIEEATAGAIFDQMEKFASYGFNKSHAAAYSLISYQTAYLKAHYPVEFMCAVMSLDITNTDKLLFFKDECKKLGFKVLKPDINHSGSDFVVEDGNIRYALGAVKGVGEANMRAIVAEREAHGPYKDISDFIHRTDIKQINRRQLEQLIKAGAFDCLEKNRGRLFANVETIMRHIASSSELKTSERPPCSATRSCTPRSNWRTSRTGRNLKSSNLKRKPSAFIFPRIRLTAMAGAWSVWVSKTAAKFSVTFAPATASAPKWPAASTRFRSVSAKPATNMLFWNCPTPAAVLREYCFRKVWHGMRKSLLPACRCLRA